MPGISRKGIDVAGGVGIEGSADVFVNSAGVMRNGDRVAGHGFPPHTPPPSVTALCKNVFVNGLLAVNEGDLATCGDSISGSQNVLTGD